jgi:hypothetical protein
VQLEVFPVGVSVKKVASLEAIFSIAEQEEIHLFGPELSVEQPVYELDVLVVEP